METIVHQTQHAGWLSACGLSVTGSHRRILRRIVHAPSRQPGGRALLAHGQRIRQRSAQVAADGGLHRMGAELVRLDRGIVAAPRNNAGHDRAHLSVPRRHRADDGRAVRHQSQAARSGGDDRHPLAVHRGGADHAGHGAAAGHLRAAPMGCPSSLGNVRPDARDVRALLLGAQGGGGGHVRPVRSAEGIAHWRERLCRLGQSRALRSELSVGGAHISRRHPINYLDERLACEAWS